MTTPCINDAQPPPPSIALPSPLPRLTHACLMNAVSTLARELVRGALSPETRTSAFVPRLLDEFDPTGGCAEFTVVVRPGTPSFAFPQNTPHATLSILARALVTHRLIAGGITAMLSADTEAWPLPLDVFVAPAAFAGPNVVVAESPTCLTLHGVVVEVKPTTNSGNVPKGIFVTRVPVPRWCTVPPAKPKPHEGQDDGGGGGASGPLDRVFKAEKPIPKSSSKKACAGTPCDESACYFSCTVDGRHCFAAVFATRPNTGRGTDALFHMPAMDLYRQYYTFHKSAATCVHDFTRPTVLDPERALLTLATTSSPKMEGGEDDDVEEMHISDAGGGGWR